MLHALFLLAAQLPPAERPIRLEFVAALTTAAPGAEIVSVQASTKRAVLTHSETGQVEVLDLADPARPRSVRVIDLGLAKGEGLTSAALPPSGDWFLAVVEAHDELAPGRALLHSLADGKRLATFPCGVGPDCVTISPSGRQALVANEAEGFDDVGGKDRTAPGSLTRIELAEDPSRSKVTQIPLLEALSGPTDGRFIEREIDDKTEEIPLGNTPEFLEPEVVAFLPGEERALVTLQENDAVAFVDLTGNRIERVLPLGHTSHPADLVDDDRFEERGTLVARREPDGIAVTPDGRHFVTADEGDTGPNVDKTPEGQPAGGGRTLSVFDLATGACVGDTGPELDRRAAAAGLYPDKRSPKKGSEPEMVLTFLLGETPLAAVTLERAGALALVDLSDPAHPAVVAVCRSGDAGFKDEPEGLAFFRDPAGQGDYLYVANEASGTLGVLRVAR
jgi:hypothetical protein